MSLVVYNSLSKKKEPFSPIKEGEVSLYTCGPTVYNYAHIGNLRTFLLEDIFIRVFRSLGYQTKHVMNFTDVDDKTIKGSIDANESLLEFTSRYEKIFFEDIDSLGFLRANHYPKATDFINQMIEMITILLEKNIAYRSDDGSIYYSIKEFKNYGTLSGMGQEDLKKGASNRVKEDEYTKDQASDFVLWKAYKKEDQNVYWDSPFGKGRPGWHIECSAMSYHYLGNHFDVHCGGIDNLFPHHENEIAQSIATYGGLFANYFFHVSHLKIDNQKMSKSLKNVYNLRDLIHEGFSPRVIRYALLTTHYRQELFFSFDLLTQCEQAITRIDDVLHKILTSPCKNLIDHELFNQQLMEYHKEFKEALLDDFNTPKAIGVLFSFIKTFNREYENLSKQDLFKAKLLFQEWHDFLGFIFPFEDNLEEEISKEQQQLIFDRLEYKKNKKFSKADEIRNLLLEQGVEIIDTKEGSSWKKIKPS